MRFLRADKTAADLETSVTNNDYLTFTVTVADGYSLNLSTPAFKLGATTGSSSYTTNLAVRSSLDGFSTSLATASHTFATNLGTPVFSQKSTDLSASPLQSLTGTLIFRLYVWDNATSNTGNYYYRLDEIALSGEVTAVPEPSSAALIADGLMLSGALLRRRDLSGHQT